MESQDETPPATPSPRPLPSIGMPILGDEVRARQQRMVLAVLAVALGLGGSVTAIVFASRTSHPPSPTDTAPDGTTPAVPLAVGYSPPIDAARVAEQELDAGSSGLPPSTPRASTAARTFHAFGRASGFRPALTAIGIGALEAEAITSALGTVMDFRRCRPEHRITIDRDASGRIERFEYRASSTQIYEARREVGGERFEGRAVPVPIERIRLGRGGQVGNSLGAALEEAGLGRTLVGVFVETFDGVMNFNTETRRGDTFRIIVDEERVDGEFLRYGTVHALEYRSQRRGVLRAFYAETPNGGDFHDETGRAVHGGWLRTPLRYDHVSSPFNPRRMHPVLRRIMPHNGVDYSAGTGTPVWAAATGVLTFVGPKGPNGNLVSIRHESGYESFYCHLSRFERGIAVGQTVRQRQVIGYVGSTGRSTGPHLHFGLKHNGEFVDPVRELNGPGRMLQGAALARFRAQVPALARELERIQLPEVAVPSSATALSSPAESASDDVMD